MERQKSGIPRSDILPIPFLRKSPFTGSFEGMRYRLERIEGEDGAEALLAQIWEGPYCFDVSTEEQRQTAEFPFSEEGICQSVDWLNECWGREIERWRKARENWQG